jgi:biopolymer transport protein ExbD
MRLQSPKRKEEPDIILVPFIDVVLMLLIFFIITTTFDRQAELGIELPRASTETARVEKSLELGIDATGRYFVNGQPLQETSLDALKAALQRFVTGAEKPPLTISADGKTPHQAVVTAMDAAGQVGFERLSIVTRHQQ